jgi:hypothetical protein
MIRIPDDNSVSEKKLFELIASGEAILMVGAGSSNIIGYPIWSHLIRRLEGEVKTAAREDNTSFRFRLSVEEEGDLIYTSRLKKALGPKRYEALMHEIFDSKGCDDCHVKLLELPFRGILTTNYDPTLEAALFKINMNPENNVVVDEGTTSNREINKFLQALNFGYQGTKLIAHLHGYYKQGRSLVLCIEDYVQKYGPNDPASNLWTLHKRIIWAMMATRRMVYVGFSMTDPFFQMMHNIVSQDLGHFGSESHFMVTRFSADSEAEAAKQLNFAETVKRKYGIKTIFFEDDAKYEGLKKYLYWMNSQVSGLTSKREVMVIAAVPEKNEFEVVDLKLTNRLEQQARNKNKETREQ